MLAVVLPKVSVRNLHAWSGFNASWHKQNKWSCPILKYHAREAQHPHDHTSHELRSEYGADNSGSWWVDDLPLDPKRVKYPIQFLQPHHCPR